MDIPMWILFVFGGIVISAFMAVKTGREDRKMENEIIEREGEVYMQRLEKEKEQRKDKPEGRSIG
ncbi:sporulation YhaL family protein [Niallia nealsonii]|uniref:SigE-dependent sporulation protein n=1 Tax=Niallia nealsonii TaxID=115979 RepID=A0A2N0Z7H9_9BACI|nr:sporulation YhaL family protein [Niallia nealsonii]PKG25444.1 SigE-dependent sporulation protein [Niallia nealsonii]